RDDESGMRTFGRLAGERIDHADRRAAWMLAAAQHLALPAPNTRDARRERLVRARTHVERVLVPVRGDRVVLEERQAEVAFDVLIVPPAIAIADERNLLRV